MTSDNRIAKNVSILITTFNRNKFIELYLEFLEINNFGGHVIIGNASSKKNYSLLNEKIKQNTGINFSTIHLHVPKVEENVSYSMNDCFIACLKEVKTKYVIMTCDDDLIFPKTLEILQNVLDKKKQYNGANADICWVGKNQINVNGQARKILPKDPIDRLNVYIQKPFHSMFTLVRKEVLDNFVPQEFRKLQFNHFAADYSWILSIVINGPIKKINKPFIFRQWHDDQLHQQNPFLSYEKFINSEFYEHDKKLFLDHLTKQISLKSSKLDINVELTEFFQKYEEFRFNSSQESTFDKFYKKVQYQVVKIFGKKITREQINDYITGYKPLFFNKKAYMFIEVSKTIQNLQKKYQVLSYSSKYK